MNIQTPDAPTIAPRPTRRWTVSEYNRMIDSGILTERDKLELLDGELIEKMTIGSKHAACVRQLIALFTRAALPVIVDAQNPVQLGERSEPEPDVMLLKPRTDYYAARKPVAADVLLLIEVADTSLAFDRSVKLPLYAEAGIEEVWILNLHDDVLEVYTAPQGNAYSQSRNAKRGELIALKQVEGCTLNITDILLPVLIQPITET